MWDLPGPEKSSGCFLDFSLFYWSSIAPFWCASVLFILFLWLGIYWASWICDFILFIKFGKFWSLFCQIFIHLSIFLLPFGDQLYVCCAQWHPLVQRGFTLLFLQSFIFLSLIFNHFYCCFHSNSLLIFSLAVSSLLLVPFRVLFILDIVVVVDSRSLIWISFIFYIPVLFMLVLPNLICLAKYIIYIFSGMFSLTNFSSLKIAFSCFFNISKGIILFFLMTE